MAMASTTEKFRELLEKSPSQNVANLCRIMLKYAEAEESCRKADLTFPKVWQREIYACLTKYYNEMDRNMEDDEADVKRLESDLDDLEFRYHMGEKIREFGLRRMYKSQNKEFRGLPWVSILKLMDQEKQLPTVWTRDKSVEIPGTPVTRAFKIAFYQAKDMISFERHYFYPAIRQISEAFRCPNDLLNTAKHYAKKKVEMVPTFTELRTSRKWLELFARIQDLECRLQEVTSQKAVLKNILRDLQNYKNIWFHKNADNNSWDLSESTRIMTYSATEDRISVDVARLLRACRHEIDGPEECLKLLLDYGGSVFSLQVARRKRDEEKASEMASIPLTPVSPRRGSDDSWVDVKSGIEHTGDRMFERCSIRGSNSP